MCRTLRGCAETCLSSSTFEARLPRLRLQDELSDYVKGLPKTRLVRLKERRGLMLAARPLEDLVICTEARMEGVWRSTAEVTIFLDSHIEATKGWLEPILARIKEER